MINNHTYYSLRYGSLSVEELLEEASKVVCRDESGWGKFALTDINTTSACLDFIRLAPKYNIHPVVGIDFRNGVEQQFIGIAQNNEGFIELNSFLSKHLEQKKNFPSKAPSFANSFVIYPLDKYTGIPLKPWEFVGIKSTQLLSKVMRNNDIPLHRLIAFQTGTFRNKKDFNAHRLLRAIDNNTLLSMLSVEEQASFGDTIENWDVLVMKFNLYPKLIRNLQFLLETASIQFDFGKPKNKKVFSESEQSDYIQLQTLTYIGFSERYKTHTANDKARLEKELETIHALGFTAYFLIAWDMLKYAERKNYYYVGRGSGANSMVAYCLFITNVDPVDLDLYFERFINKHRKSPPDFDLDFSWKDRDDVIAYMFERHGRSHTSMLATYNTFKHKSAIREIGKVFGLPKGDIDFLTRIKSMPRNIDHLSDLTIRYSHVIKDFPNHLGIHAGGIIISDQPIFAYTAQEYPPKGVPITQFSMQEAEDIGLHKFDVLSQRGLGKIRDAIILVKSNHNVDLSQDINNIDLLKKDPGIIKQLKDGNTIGCFYVESPGMRMLLTKLQTTTYTGLVAASSIIRPGVSKSGMMREYIERARSPEKQKYVHPKLGELMAETYGVMVYQEDVLKVAHFFAGLTLEEADVLRRGMSLKFRERSDFDIIKEKFFENCAKKQYKKELVVQVWTQIESFANYAFSKGHSASYAVESFQSLYIKAYYPLEYMVATINNGGGFYSRESYIHEARMNGGNIHGPCINNSSIETTIYEKEIFLGFSLVSELANKTICAIKEARNAEGTFADLYDFIKRVPISKEQLNLLIRVGAFRFTAKTKKELLWEGCLTLGEQPKQTSELFDVKPKKFKIPKLSSNNHEDMADEMELLGFPLLSPFNYISETKQGKITVADMKRYVGKTIKMLGYYVFHKTTKTSNGQYMYFGTFVDEVGDFIDSVHFSQAVKLYPFTGIGVYLLEGVIVEEFNYLSIEVKFMKRIPYDGFL